MSVATQVRPPTPRYIIRAEFRRTNKVSASMSRPACPPCTHSHALLFLSYLCMSSLRAAPFLNRSLSAFPPPSPPPVSPWRWGPSAVSRASCEHRREGRDAFQRQRRSGAGEPWQQGETQTQQPTTPNRESRLTYPSDACSTPLSLLPKCHFAPSRRFQSYYEKMAGRTGQGGADAPLYFKPLE